MTLTKYIFLEKQREGTAAPSTTESNGKKRKIKKMHRQHRSISLNIYSIFYENAIEDNIIMPRPRNPNYHFDPNNPVLSLMRSCLSLSLSQQEKKAETIYELTIERKDALLDHKFKCSGKRKLSRFYIEISSIINQSISID